MNKLLNTRGSWILFAAAVLLFAGLGRSDIYILDEARNAQCAREMMEQNEWVVPTFNQELRGHKPPLHYYFMRAAYTVFGVNAFAARFFSALLGLSLLVFLWKFVQKKFDDKTAFWTVASLTASIHFIFEFRLSVPDPYLIAFITAGILLFYEYMENRKLKWLLISAFFAALAILSKGPVALALPAMAVLGWAITMGKWRQLLHWHLLLYLVVVLLVAVPWFWMVHKATNGQFTRDFFFTHNINRFKSPMEGHGGLFLLTPLMAILGMMPLMVFGFRAFMKIFRRNPNSLLVLCVWMVLVFMMFFSISGTKLPNYTMPCYPFIAIILGHYIKTCCETQGVAKKGWLIFLVLFNFLLAIGVYAGLNAIPELKHLRWFCGIFLLPVSVLFAEWSSQKRRRLRSTLENVLVAYILLIFIINFWAYPAVYRHNPVSQTNHLLPKTETVYAYKIYNPAFNFYLNRPVVLREHLNYFRDSLPAGKTSFIITRKEFENDFAGFPVTKIAEQKDIFENPVTVILQWHK